MPLGGSNARLQDNLRGQSGVQIQCLGPPDVPLKDVSFCGNIPKPFTFYNMYK